MTTIQQINPGRSQQRGSMILGIIIGVLVGLGVALGVAVYVMKVPTPFNSKSTSRTPAQDAAEVKKNKDWDPNAGLSNKPAAKPEAASAAPAATPNPAPTAPIAPATAPTAPSGPAAAAAPNKAAPPAAATPTNSNNASTSDIEFFVQVAAFNSETEAHAMRGKLALSGFEGKIVEREQSGRTVYRVRTGPYTQAASEKAKASLEALGFETVMVRSQR